ncbi:hypothetical protein PR003_g4867 [Phytophthora rubi]|uniref:BZIP domain-containing protein n=1 Tax=Phytophthora rubi TaxID=129364 RepID=A0A6A3JPK8_9STRA|nr:hypothetical protein PR002_g19247 [Phytophthora rubi]KAE9008212.1 hypothetical protein PR001_g16757 [Phytophthora rubi]KAE9351501.1 hypothetical protein PR003_g4867 [Phytophthora rubi]
MHSLVLLPPNALTLSDKLVCDVKQRTRPSRVNSTTTFIDARGSEANTGVSAAATALPSVPELIARNDSPPPGSRPVCLSSDQKTANKVIASIKAANHPIGIELQNAVVAEALRKKIRHRERCRVNQARYRKRKHKSQVDVQNGIARLWDEIKDLQSRCNDLSGVPASRTPWGVAGDYFRHFNYFLAHARSQYASKFFHDIMAPDVVDGSPSGGDTQIETWRCFALYFGDVHVELRGMKMPSEDTLVASTITMVTVTRNTLRYAFPHLNSDGDAGTQGGDWSPIAGRILGQRLVVHGSVLFGWDNTSNKVVRFQAQADLLTPMLKLLGNLEDVSFIFSKALITPDCRFV